MKIKRVHFVGIAGVGMSALAIYCQEKGMRVTGSDTGEAYFTPEALKKAGINWQQSFDPAHVPADADLVVVTNAHGGLRNNPEAQAAVNRGLKVVSLAQAIGLFANPYKVIAVAGTHGKTTTTAMLASILYNAGLDPSWVPIGTTTIPTLPAHGHAGKGEYFITEADEYLDAPREEGGRPRFLYLQPTMAVITSAEWDHPDVYPDAKSYLNAFQQFVKLIRPQGLLIANGDWPSLRKIAKSCRSRVWWYGDKHLWPNLRLNVFGHHNYLNATAAARVAHELGVKQETILAALAAFKGSARRLEKVGQWQGITLIDDYAHHPTEIKAALAAIKGAFAGRRLVLVFQPHTFSRTEALLKDFAVSFADADEVYILDIFGSAREKSGKIDSQTLVAAAGKNHPHIVYLPGDLAEAAAKVRPVLKEGDVLVTMGATEVYRLHDLIR